MESSGNASSTRDVLLESAFDLFARRGYRGTTVADICESAGANIAAVNYHFGSKEDLYRETWRSRLERILSEDSPPDWDTFEAETAEGRIRERIHAMVRRHLSIGEPGRFTSLIMKELNNPTGLIDTVLEDFVGPIREALLGDVAEVLGGEPTDESVRFCTLSIFNQCFGLRFRSLPEKPIVDFESYADEDVDRLADHIADFSLAGVKALQAGGPGGGSAP